MIQPNNLPKELTQFLRKHDALDAFRRNIALYSDKGKTPRHPINQLNEAFNWYRTPQGHAYWRNLHTEWMKYLKV